MGGQTPTSSHFLKFDQPVVDLEKQRVAVAFALDALPNVQAFDPAKPQAKQFRIAPANPGRVAVYFPAEKETSGLRFHLHAPFVPELSRASIKETPGNQPLFEQLAALTAAALPRIRDLGLLTTDFLAVLPNPQDAVPPRYEPIRKAIVEAMNTEPLTPTHGRSHEPAKRLLQARASLKELLSAADLEVLVSHDDAAPLWAVAAPQKNSNADQFLDGLAITQWDVEQFVDLIIERASEHQRYSSSSSRWLFGRDKTFMAWLSNKSIGWHQNFYALLNEYILSITCRKNHQRESLKRCRLVRLANGKYSAAGECFFPSDDGKDDDGLPRVDKGVYTSGKSKGQQEKARKFLDEIGVREVGEAELVETILKQRYVSADVKSRKEDLKRFIKLVETQPDKVNLFQEYFVFEGDDGRWREPGDIFLDQPFMDTGLTAYYDALAAARSQGDEETDDDDGFYDEPCAKGLERSPLALSYNNCGVSLDKLAKFAAAVGAQTRVEIKPTCCFENPEWSYLCFVGGERHRNPINQDYTIESLSELLRVPFLPLSKLIWRTMSSSDVGRYLRATYQKNERHGPRHADSQLVHQLRKAAWVPQNEGTAVSFVRPAEASRDLLPPGFPFDPGWAWLKAIHFEAEVAKRSETHRQRQAVAEELGVSLDDIELINQHRDDFQRWKESVRSKAARPAFPVRTSGDFARREAGVSEQWQEAVVKEYNRRERSIRTSRTAVDPRPLLVDYYTNDEGQMVCQLCCDEMPFKKRDGQYYFEAMEAFGREHFPREHQAQFLALCPVCAAKYNEFVKSDDEKLAEMRRAMLASDEPSIPVMLGSSVETLRFVEVHFDDLKTILKEDEAVGGSAETD